MSFARKDLRAAGFRLGGRNDAECMARPAKGHVPMPTIAEPPYTANTYSQNEIVTTDIAVVIRIELAATSTERL